MKDWIRSYFSEEQLTEVLDILSGCGSPAFYSSQTLGPAETGGTDRKGQQ
jgi:hypothetical protein